MSCRIHVNYNRAKQNGGGLGEPSGGGSRGSSGGRRGGRGGAAAAAGQSRRRQPQHQPGSRGSSCSTWRWLLPSQPRPRGAVSGTLRGRGQAARSIPPRGAARLLLPGPRAAGSVPAHRPAAPRGWSLPCPEVAPFSPRVAEWQE